MGRPHRFDEPGAWHHVMNRGADRQDTFTDDGDRELFEYQLGELDRLELFETHAYCFMSNHFHLLGRSPCGRLSESLHRLSSEYVRYYNERHRRDGPLFRGRFVSVAVGGDEQLVTASRYVHRNPLAFVPADALPAYRWSSFGAYLGRRASPEWLHRDVVSALVGDRDEHRRFVLQPMPSDEVTVPRWATDWLTADHIVQAVARVIGPTTSGTARRDARQLAVTLAVEFRVAPGAQLAVELGLRSASAVRTAARRGRVRVADDSNFCRLHGRVVGELDRAAA